MSNQNRKRLRLAGYDYRTEGAYFITVCTKNKEKLLCEILPPELPGDAPEIRLTAIGKIVTEATQKIPGIDKWSCQIMYT